MLDGTFLPLILASFLIFSRVHASSDTTANGVTVAGGLFHTCVIVEDFSLRCFGGGNSDAVENLAPTESVSYGFGNYGQIGSGDNETLGDEEGEMGSALAAVDLGDNTVQDVAAGQSHTCVVLTSGNIACFGYNYYGQLGLGNQTARGRLSSDMGDGLALVDLGTYRSATRIGCGTHHSCAVLDNGSLKCWGRNTSGMLGLGDTQHRGDSADEMGDDLPAVDLGTGRTAVSVAGGRFHTCALLDNATLKCWGGGNSTGHNYGQLGQGNTFDVGSSEGQMGDALPAIDLGTNRTVVAFGVGYGHTCALLDDGSLRCFGRNFDGQLGLGDTEDRGDEPGEMGDDLPTVDLGTDRYAMAITCGRWHTCAILDNGDVKCFGANTSNDLGAGQLGLEDSDNRGKTEATTGDGLEAVQLGTAYTSGWIFAAFDHTCVIFDDAQVKCWGLNASGQLGLGHTEDVGAEEGTMGDSLAVVELGIGVVFPTSIATDTSSSDVPSWFVLLAAGVGALLIITLVFFICYRLWRKRRLWATAPSTFDFPSTQTGKVLPNSKQSVYSSSVGKQARAERYHNRTSHKTTAGAQGATSQEAATGSIPSGAGGMAAVGAAGVIIAGRVYYGWDVVSRVAETLPWIGAAFCLLNDLVDVVDTKFELEGNLEGIKGWAISLRNVILQISRQIEIRPADNANALRYLSMDVISNLEDLVGAITEWERKGILAQYTSSRSCKQAVDAADTALRGALQRLTVGQTAELMAMVNRLDSADLVVTEKFDMIFEQLRRQEVNRARLELRLAEYSEAMAEVFGHYIHGKADGVSSGKTLRQLGKEALDRLQISSEDISYPSHVPFATGTFSEVYQVVHEGVVKAAKKTNLSRLGLRPEDTDRVFGRFVKELYILSQMRSERVVSIYGAVATPTELTLVMEFVERGSLRMILDDDKQREQMTIAVKHGLLTDTAEGMKYLYDAGVEHRDLKSANCLVTHDWRVKISDFGLSNTTDAISSGSTSTVGSFRGGTLIYVAPELLVEGSYAVQNVPAELSDVYSFGVIVWDVICGNGELPWGRLTTTQLHLPRNGEHPYISTECDDFYRFELILSTLKRKMLKTQAVPSWPGCRTSVEETRPSTLDRHYSVDEEERETLPYAYMRGGNISRPSAEHYPPPPPYAEAVTLPRR